MTQDEFVELLKKEYDVPGNTKCLACGCDRNNPNWNDAINRLSSGHSCIVDIQMGGQWSGHVMEFLASLYKLNPKDPRWEKVVEGFTDK